ncbi:2-oxoglutarate dehydrogenase E1 component [Paenibacillaceae bacterium]|nr:2-oxoglutarate dehydrogenase E1 component [Paenibacillaceae bacterium]
MKQDSHNRQNPWLSYYGPNLGYIQEQYELYQADPSSVESSIRSLFEQHGQPPSSQEAGTATVAGTVAANNDNSTYVNSHEQMKKSIAAGQLVWNIRTYGHLAAKIDPIGLSHQTDTTLLEHEYYGLTKEDLKAIPASVIWDNGQGEQKNGLDAINELLEIYTGSIAFEFSHVHAQRERDWLNKQVESAEFRKPLKDEERVELLKKLVRVQEFESFLHRTFVGQKRFSIEGMDILVPMLDELVNQFSANSISRILMGMAHRGRLNVLANVLGKPLSRIFSEFHHAPNKDLMPSEGSIGINFGWTGDVKYHLGADRSLSGGAVPTRITLANNPSHLEFVNPVVEGFTRAAQEDRTQAGFPKRDIGKAAAILMHGDAAFPGEGVVAETLNFNQLRGYRNGGTVHIIVNNRLGFTTGSLDARSTHYASDVAKGYEIPIVHVNADDPDACIAAVRLAAEYRIRFKKDFLIDLIGYRRYGHNETDDPDTTQPIVYSKVHRHPIIVDIYSKRLNKAGVCSPDQAKKIKQDIVAEMQEAYDKTKETGGQETPMPPIINTLSEEVANVSTSVDLEKLREINAELLNWPESFQISTKLKRILQRRATMLNEGEKVDWALAEALAFASILSDGRPIRLSGQDSERGTFAHRNLVLHDSETGQTYSPMHRLSQAKASFAIHNSPLSETAVLGFEYGYNVYAPETLVIWEAQYGDFTNVAQVIIDQFIAAGKVKWHQRSSLVMLLPHGYEGQGPEHSSARLERFLQSAAEDNWTVANVTSAAQYFHLLRRQAAWTDTERAVPLIVMTPKSLIRNPRVASPAVDLSEGGFRKILFADVPAKKTKLVKRLIFCSGKVSVDLEEAIASDEQNDWSWLQVIRVEQLYPFPKAEIAEQLSVFANAEEIVWVQEEPKNMGAWTAMEPQLRELAGARLPVSYIGRPERSSTASGYQHIHRFEQQYIVSRALKPFDTDQMKEAGKHE